MAITAYLLPPMPAGLEGLAELALDLRWSWSHATDRLWEHIDPELWARTRNPWLILQNVAYTRLEALRDDPELKQMIADNLAAYYLKMSEPGWFEQNYPDTPLSIAYFSMEFGLGEAIPIYSGGLGILAGDYLKTASDLGVSAAGIGLLYQQGYFRQVISAEGAQTEIYPYNDPSQLPVTPMRNSNGEWLHVEVDFPGRRLRLRVWEAKVGRVKLYLLDSNDPLNTPADRGITSELYGGGHELRLQQEIVLGIGGWRLLRSAGIEPDICHFNEGHASLAVLERARSFMEKTGHPLKVALATTRAGNIFTTHTAVDAGFDRFSSSLVEHYLESYAGKLGVSIKSLLDLGRKNPDDKAEPFNMAYLAIRGSGAVNGVSRLHAEVSRRIFQPIFPQWPREEVPVTYVTNGVHMPSWDSAAADAVWSDACGQGRWLGTMESVAEFMTQVPDDTLWALRAAGTQQLVRYARQRYAWQVAASGASAEQVRECGQCLDFNALTIGFARRFTSYKRPNLLLREPDRLVRLLSDQQYPVQLIIAGKAHPQDIAGKAMIKAWSDFARRPDVRRRVMFLADYDMVLAEQMVQGVDLWINTPRHPWEACGTSGMKVLVNGGLNFSELDGWWAEAYRPEVGWALGDEREHGDDPAHDAREAQQLYHILENEIIPCFFDRDASGVPRRWVARMRSSMAELTPRFSSNRMLREYVEKLYLPASRTLHSRYAEDARQCVVICDLREKLEAHWSQLHFGRLEIHSKDDFYEFVLPVYLDELDPDAVDVQLHASNAGEKAEVHSMRRGEPLAGAVNSFVYRASLPAHRPASQYTPRIIPAIPGAAIPLEDAHILWYH
ncbi:MAG: alpha-glucan family phosphorylase [Chloroflexi bacterium]|nr:alpha-glucan family phosphorylase [Chloroflexota bacterium]